jgi:hypothetical protein
VWGERERETERWIERYSDDERDRVMGEMAMGQKGTVI